MQLNKLLLLAGVSLAPFFIQPAQAQKAAALTGQVSSAEEGAMEGVVVSAKKEGSNITTSVVSDDKGRYSFPADRLSPGQYKISIWTDPDATDDGSAAGKFWVMVDPAQWYGKNMSLHGFVDGVPLHRPNSLDYKFKVKTGSYVVDATYTGLIPDTFKEGSEIVASGQLAVDGFHANNITAKCPSRYESAKTGAEDNK